ncbi:HNH endonuclease [Listeria seeligeri]|uniref:HNH endonuclease n=1 Tax=Listeria seeligeri TaxID=1640 RepID=UPI0017C8D8E5|nr:HNH endonuclease [Listeria seeligeri]MBC2092732.1 HNH endonuclease [Listeria seeligeri]
MLKNKQSPRNLEGSDCRQIEKSFYLQSFYNNRKHGKVPSGYSVHHKLPLDDSGTNSFDNLMLIKDEPYHKLITNAQTQFSKKLKAGESVKVKFPIPDGNIYPK